MALAREALRFEKGGAYTKRILLSQGVVNTTPRRRLEVILGPGKSPFFPGFGEGNERTVQQSSRLWRQATRQDTVRGTRVEE